MLSFFERYTFGVSDHKRAPHVTETQLGAGKAARFTDRPIGTAIDGVLVWARVVVTEVFLGGRARPPARLIDADAEIVLATLQCPRR